MFRLPALPGHGVIIATALDGRLYRLADGAAAAGFPSPTSSGDRRTVYHLFSPDAANSVQAVEIDPAMPKLPPTSNWSPSAAARSKSLTTKTSHFRRAADRRRSNLHPKPQRAIWQRPAAFRKHGRYVRPRPRWPPSRSPATSRPPPRKSHRRRGSKNRRRPA